MTDERALDREVAKALGYTYRYWVKEGTGEWAPPGYPSSGEKPFNDDELPRFSSDPAACALVKAKLRETGIQFKVEWWLKNTYATMDEKGHYHSMSGDSEEEAVCRLAVACAKAGLLKVNV